MISGDFAHFSEKTVFEANFRIIGFISMIVLITLGLFVSDSDISGYYLLFESISAVSNTGLSLGATPLLSATGMGLLMILMTVGKIGFISFIISFFPNLQKLLDQSGREANEFPVD
jgi:Trk-type K+ transport system membrane component